MPGTAVFSPAMLSAFLIHSIVKNGNRDSYLDILKQSLLKIMSCQEKPA